VHELACRGPRHRIGHDLGERGGADVRMLLERAVQVIEKIKGVVRVVLPRVFAVENHAHHRWLSRLGGCVNALELRAEMRSRLFAVPALVFEADQVGQTVVAKKAVQAVAFGVEAVGAIQECVAVHRRDTRTLQGVGEHRFTARGPTDLVLREQFEKRRRDRAFGRPDPQCIGFESVAMRVLRAGEVPGDPRASSGVVIGAW